MTAKKGIGFLLILSLLLAVSAIFTASAAEITVDIVSFTRGAQEDLRSSELLEAKVTGYNGNVRELTYKWTNTLGTYLYVYNSHNMYGINNTDGEIEIYNSDERVSSSANMSGRSYDGTFSGTGYAWAAIYGASLSASDLVGTVTVEVYDADGNLLATDTHEGTRVRTGGSFWRPTYTYSGFLVSDLDNDVSNVYFGLFEGDTKNVKILLGESSIVHITCVECSISNPRVVSGAETIEIVVDNDTEEAHIKSISGTSNGEAKVEITVEKGNCKFHQNVSTTRTIEVYVYKKPTTTSTATAIMLDNLDDRCTYYIGGVAGEQVDGKEYVVFEGLTPNTQYQIEVVGQANDKTEPVYAYVYETTKPAHTGTIEVILNGTYDSSTGTAFGERVDITSVMPNVETIYLRYEDSEIYFPLEKVSTGVYTSVLSNGNYTVYYSESGSTAKVKLGDQVLTVDNASRTRELFFNSVTYDVAGGTPALPTEYYLVDSKVTVNATVPEKEGFLFTHWTDDAGNTYKSGATLVEEIGEAHTLTAQYVESFDVYANIIIKHISAKGDDHNNDNGMHDISFTVDRRFGGTGDYTELVSKTIDWDGNGTYNDGGYLGEYVNMESEHKDRTIYTARTPMLVNVAKEAEYTVTTVKSGYMLQSVEKTQDADGNLVLTATLIFDPNEYDIAFSVELDAESKKVADALKPVAVNVKVLAWGDPIDVEGEELYWWHIIQQHDTYTRVALDADGKGSGSFPVWTATTDTHTPYYYRIEVVSYETADGTILPAFDKDDAHTVYKTENNRYFTTVSVTGGAEPNGSTLPGAYYDSATQAQVGTIHGVVTIDVFDVTFDPNGGMLNGSTEDTVLRYQIGIPNLAEYVPTREGGYVFDGWYLADANGAMTDKAAVSDTIIFENTTLVAKWRDPLTVQGQVAVDGTYYDHDRASHIVVLLQRIDANGYAETVQTETVVLTYGEDTEHGIGGYAFTEIPDIGHNYRIKTVASNYHTHYLNETSDAKVEDYDSYKEETEDDMYLADFGDDSVANVHLHLHFMPENFDLQYAVDASSIGEGFRPTAAEVLVLCDTGVHIDPQHWDVISQMIDKNGDLVGNDTALTDGKGAGSEPVWQIKADGATPYDYSVRVDSLTFNEEENPYGENLPYAIYYNGSARYGEVNGQTQTLVATVVPRMYSITFELGEDMQDVEIGGMESYLTVNGTLEDTYYWSYGKAVTAAPAAKGYTFLGWYDADGAKVTTVSAGSAEDVTLYAKWVVTPEFVTLVDAGYYSVARDSEEKEGIIALNARISNYDAVKDHIQAFGIYIYDTTDTSVSITAESADMERLGADGGAYHVTVSGIAPAGFTAKVLAAPYVVVDGEIVIGEMMTGSVAEINKWLGEK